MSNVVYAENDSLTLLAPSNNPEKLQETFAEEIKKRREIAQKCSEDSFTIKTTLNELKKGFKDHPDFYEEASKLEKMSVEELKAYNEEQRQFRKENRKQNKEAGETEDNLQAYAEQLLLQTENKKELADANHEAAALEKYAELSRNYGDDFSYLYQLQQNVETRERFADDDEKGEIRSVKVKFNVIDMPANSGIIAQAEKLRQDALGGVSSTLALDVEIDGGVPFTLSVKPFDEQANETQKKMQLSFSEAAIQQLTSGPEEENKAKIERIFKFCADNGISTSDMSLPTDRDGNVQVDEKLHDLMSQVREKINEENAKAEREADQRREEEMRSQGLIREPDDELLPTKDEIAGATIENVGDDVPFAENVLDADNTGKSKDKSKKNAEFQQENEPQAASLTEDEQQNDLGRTPPPAPRTPAPARPAPTSTQNVEELMDDMMINDIGRIEDKSFFKRRQGDWNVYIIYDHDVKHNKPVEQDKDGNIKYNYAVKIFFKVDSNGVLHLSYRTPNGKKLDPLYSDAVAGKLKDMKITHFRIPKGWRNDDVATWRKSLAEKGIVPTGISLNRSKVEGMLEAAKKKLSTEEYNKYKYRLGMQMLRYNREKGKRPDPSEQGFIDGLIASHDYGAFMNGYSDCLKSKIRRNLRTASGDFNAVDKIANYRALRRLYDAYKESLGNANIMASTVLTPAEKAILRRPENADLLCNVRELRPDQIGKLFDILQEQSKHEVEQKLDTALERLYNPPAGRRRDTRPARTIINQVLTDEKDMCKDVFEELVANGQDELKLVETVGTMSYDYESRHPAPTTTRTATKTNIPPAPQIGNERTQPDAGTAKTPIPDTARASTVHTGRTPQTTGTTVPPITKSGKTFEM